MNEFKIKSKPLQANPLFMDIHKHKVDEPKYEDAFTKYKDYRGKISMLFRDLPHTHKFWLISGIPIKNLHELYHALEEMNDETYFHHVSRQKNDFSEWIKNVYHDEDLAFKLYHAKTRKEAKNAIEERIDQMVDVGDHDKNEKSFFKALIHKLSRQNDKLERELQSKKEWLLRKQKELEA